MSRTRMLMICHAPRGGAQSRVQEAAKHLLAQVSITDDEKQLANQALEGLKR